MSVLRLEMHNGVTVSDWLGTAGLAARDGARRIEEVRDGLAPMTITTLKQALADLEQAREEVAEVLKAIA